MRLKVLRLAALAGVFTSSAALACLAPASQSAERSSMGADACRSCGDSEVFDLGESDSPTFQFASAGGGGLPGGENVVTVFVVGFDYSINPAGPAVDAVVNAGDTVHWVFNSIFHTVTSVSGGPDTFDSGLVTTSGATFDHTFNTPGTFQYFCTVHGFDNGSGTAGGMSGIITVRAVPEPMSAALPMLLLRRRR